MIVAALLGAAGMFVLLCAIGAIIDEEMREAVLRLLALPVVLIVYPFVRYLERLPRAGRMRVEGLVREINSLRFEKVAWGVASKRWAIVMVKRVSEELPVPPERVP